MEKKDKKDKRMFLSTGKLILASLTLSFVMILLTYGAVVGMRQKHLEQQADTTLFETMRLADFEGGTYTSEQLKNSKLTVINIWETTCSACLSEGRYRKGRLSCGSQRPSGTGGHHVPAADSG